MPLPFKTKKVSVKVSFSFYHGVRVLALVYSHWLNLKSYQTFLAVKHKKTKQCYKYKILPV